MNRTAVALVVFAMGFHLFANDDAHGQPSYPLPEATLYRPSKKPAKVAGAEVSMPGDHEVCVGDMIELEYTYPVTPSTIPKEIALMDGFQGNVLPSDCGWAQGVRSELIGSQTIVFSYVAKKPGTENVWFAIVGPDGSDHTYEYNFKVVERDESHVASGPMVRKLKQRKKID